VNEFTSFEADNTLIFDPGFSESSLGFRPKRTAHGAIKQVKHGGHDTFMCGLDFLNLDLRYYRHGLLANLVLLVNLDSNHSKLAQTTTFAGVPTRRHILELGDGSVAQTRAR